MTRVGEEDEEEGESKKEIGAEDAYERIVRDGTIGIRQWEGCSGRCGQFYRKQSGERSGRIVAFWTAISRRV